MRKLLVVTLFIIFYLLLGNFIPLSFQPRIFAAAQGTQSPTVSNAIVNNYQTSLTLPSGAQEYVYGFVTGGAPSSGFAYGQYASVTNAIGNVPAALALTTSNTNSFSTSASYPAIGGASVSGFSSVSSSYGSNGTPSASSASDTFTVSVPGSLVVVVGEAGGEQSISISGIPGLSVDATNFVPPCNQGLPPVMEIASAYPSVGTYTVTEQTSQCAAGQNPDNAGDLIGVFVFTPSSTTSTYSVTFSESGLPSGTSWSVTFNGQTESSTGSSITFSGIPPGTYTYTVTPPQGFVASPSSGSLSVSTSNVIEPITFLSPTQSVPSVELTATPVTPSAVNLSSPINPLNTSNNACTFPYGGSEAGCVSIQWNTQNAVSCVLSSDKSLAGLPTNVLCGDASTEIALPAVPPGSPAVPYTFTLTATSATGSTTSQSVTVYALPTQVFNPGQSGGFTGIQNTPIFQPCTDIYCSIDFGGSAGTDPEQIPVAFAFQYGFSAGTFAADEDTSTAYYQTQGLGIPSNYVIGYNVVANTWNFYFELCASPFGGGGSMSWATVSDSNNNSYLSNAIGIAECAHVEAGPLGDAIQAAILPLMGASDEFSATSIQDLVDQAKGIASSLISYELTSNDCSANASSKVCTMLNEILTSAYGTGNYFGEAWSTEAGASCTFSVSAGAIAGVASYLFSEEARGAFSFPQVGISGVATPASGQNRGCATSTQSQTTGLEVVADSSIDILVVGPSGQEIGYNGSAVVNTLPGALFTGPGTEPEMILIPGNESGVYKITTFGRASGAFNITVTSFVQSSIIISSVRLNGTATRGSEQSYYLSRSDSGELALQHPALLGYLFYVGIGVGLALVVTALAGILYIRRRRTTTF